MTDKTKMRPTVHSLSLLPQLAQEATEITRFYREFRAPTLDYADERREREAEENLTSLHLDSFPDIYFEAFDGLFNPDVFYAVLSRYLTFVVALTPEARKDIGFSDMPGIAAQIERLAISKRQAQTATFALLPAVRSSMQWMVKDLEGLSRQPSVFARLGGYNYDFLFRPDSLSKSHIDEQKAGLVVKRAVANLTALDWIMSHARPYVEHGLRGDKESLDKIILHIKKTGDWRLAAGHEMFAKLARKEDALRWNLFLIEDLEALLNAYDAGDLFEYSEKDIAELGRLFESSLLADDDISKFVKLIKSPALLLELARDEGLVHYSVSAENEPFRVDPTIPEFSRVYGTVIYMNYHSYSVKSKFEQPLATRVTHYFDCKGAEIRKEGSVGHTSVYSDLYAFPFDQEPLSWFVCAKVARERGIPIPHAMPAGPFSEDDVAPGMVIHFNNAGTSGDRASLMVPNGTKLYERATSRCSLKVEWNVDLAGQPGIDIARPVATLGMFVERTLDNPFVYESQTVVESKTKQLFTNDMVPRNPRKVNCKAFGESISQEIPTDRPLLGKMHPPEIVDAKWHFLRGKAVVVPPGFRDALIVQMRKKRATINEEVLKKLGERFREPQDGIDFLAYEMLWKGVKEDQIKQVMIAYKVGGRRAAFDHPAIVEFRKANESVFQKAMRRDRFYVKRQYQLELLQTFAVWGLGECLFKVPEYQPLAALFWEKELVGAAAMTVPEAIRILQDPRIPMQYPYAASALRQGAARFESKISSFANFPPKPELPDGLSYLYHYRQSQDSFVDATAALAVSEYSDCRPGHATIVELEKLLDVIRNEGLLRNGAD